jgi:hypothetical protein
VEGWTIGTAVGMVEIPGVGGSAMMAESRRRMGARAADS